MKCEHMMWKSGRNGIVNIYSQIFYFMSMESCYNSAINYCLSYPFCYSICKLHFKCLHAQWFFQAFCSITFFIGNWVYWVTLGAGKHNEFPQMGVFQEKAPGKYACVVLNPESLIVIIKCGLIVTRSVCWLVPGCSSLIFME